MSHAAFIPFDLYGLSASGICVVASLVHEVLGTHAPRSELIRTIARGFTWYYAATAGLTVSFFGFLFLSRSYLRQQHQKRKNGLDFSSFKRWTDYDFAGNIQTNFEKFKQQIKVTPGTKGKILWADVNHFEVPRIKWPIPKKLIIMALFAPALWIARSTYLQIFLVLGNIYTSARIAIFLNRAGIIKALVSSQIVSVVKTRRGIHTSLQDFFVRKIYVVTSLGMYSFHVESLSTQLLNHDVVSFLVYPIDVQIPVYTRIDTTQIRTTIFEPSIVVYEHSTKIFTTAKMYPFHFEEFADAVYAVLDRRAKSNFPKIVALLLNHLPHPTLPGNVIDHGVPYFGEFAGELANGEFVFEELNEVPPGALTLITFVLFNEMII
eukprot:Phypoly_transcript_07467.p1 GENE.Phypoly_transcript_07467~~Phypoly_transcript_07467.p1  ORF type:complete len:378 (+),score=31.87 Phypoly_transcript_07467:51-1184(+)